MDRPVCINVLVVVAEGREDEFLHVMRLDAIGSRLEPGCLCFHVSAAPDARTYMFYEVYVNSDAVTKHKRTKHYQTWDAFRNAGGIERQHNTVCEGVFVSDGDLLDPSAEAPQNQISHQKTHGGASFDAAQAAIPRRATRTKAPPDFGHPRGLIEDPIRVGTLSNFGRAGVRHMKKASPHTFSPSSATCLTSKLGGMGHDVEGLVLPPGSGRKSSAFGDAQRKQHQAHFDGMAPGKDDGSEFAGRQKGSAAASSRHLEKNFVGMALTPDSGAKSAAPKMGGTQYEWSKQHASASFRGGGGLKPRSSAQIPDVDEVNDFQHKGNDKSLPWTKQFQSEKWQAGMALTHSPDPKSPPRRNETPFDCDEQKNHDPYHNRAGTKKKPQQPLSFDAAGGSRTSSTDRITRSQVR